MIKRDSGFAERRRQVRIASCTGQKVPYDLRTLIEDGWSLTTIRRVIDK